MYTRFGLPKEERIHGSRWPIVSGDTVQVIEGPEKGKVGQVLFVKRKTNQLVVKDVNISIRIQKRAAFRPGYFYRTESPVHYTNVQLIDPVHQKPCKVRFTKDPTTNETVRYSSMSGAILPKPKREYTPPNREKRWNRVKDTSPEAVWKQTFVPFVRNWRPEWSVEKSAAKKLKEAQIKTKESTYRKFKDSFTHNPIASV
jgi:large subunit ribosomal protein L24